MNIGNCTPIPSPGLYIEIIYTALLYILILYIYNIIILKLYIQSVICLQLPSSLTSFTNSTNLISLTIIWYIPGNVCSVNKFS